MRKASLMGLSISRVWALQHETGAQYSAWRGPQQGWRCGVEWQPHLDPANRFRSPTRDVNFLRSDSKCRRNVSTLSSLCQDKWVQHKTVGPVR